MVPSKLLYFTSIDFEKSDLLITSVCLQKEKRVQAGTTTVSRSGFYQGSVKRCETTSNDGFTITTCWCNTDLCNVTQRVRSGFVGIFLMSFLVLLRYFYQTSSTWIVGQSYSFDLKCFSWSWLFENSNYDGFKSWGWRQWWFLFYLQRRHSIDDRKFSLYAHLSIGKTSE